MLHLSRHIESLLLQHHCVIIPEFGGFITQYVSARFIEEENLFLPPYRSVKFNPHLTANDGMLVQSYMSAYGIGYGEALVRVKMAVAEMKEKLLREGTYVLHGVGTLCLSVQGVYTFQPNEAGALSPALYGLDALQVKSVVAVEDSEVKEATNEVVQATVVPQTDAARYYTIRLRKEVVNYLAAAVVMLVCYFAWSVPVSNTSATHLQQATFLATDVFAAPAKQATLEPRIIMEDESVSTLQQEAPVVETLHETAETDSNIFVKQAKVYTIVVCSCVPRSNAERLISKLVEQGIEASIFEKQGVLRVVVGNYSTEAEAVIALRKLRDSMSGYDEAWVLKK